MSKSNIFISYARKDGRTFAAELREKLLAEQFSIWQDVISLPPGEQWWLKIKEAIDNVQTMILLLSDAALTSEVVRREWAYARSVGIQILPVTKDNSIFSKAPRWIAKRDVLILDEHHPDLIYNWSRLLKALENPPSRQRVPFMAEPLTEYFVERSSLQTHIANHVLHETHIEPRSGVTIALLGAGGFGKTTMAQAVCFNPEIVDAYTGGILWATLGESSDGLTGKIAEIVKSISGANEAFTTPEDAARRLRELMADRDCLFVLDDVWDIGQVELFRGIASCTYVITTRHRSIAAQVSTDTPIEIGEMNTEEATSLLLNYLPEARRPYRDDQKQLGELAARLGEWPLLLRIIAGTLREEVNTGSNLRIALDWVNEGLNSEGLTAFDRTEGQRNSALAASMGASLRRYSRDEIQRLFELAIFPEDTNIPEIVAHKLWSQTAGLSTFQSSKLLRRLAGQFFLMDAVEDGLQKIRFHDRLREYLVGQLADQIVEVHNSLLASYNPLHQKGWHIVSDRYLLNHLVYHLLEAGQTEELPKLFADDNWMLARWEAEGYVYTGFIEDLMTAWQITKEKAFKDDMALALCVHYALIRTTINSLADNYIPELVARAVEIELQGWSFRRGLSIAANMSDVEHKAKLYVALIKTDKGTIEEFWEVYEQGLSTALTLKDKYLYAQLLLQLAKRAPNGDKHPILVQGMQLILKDKEENDLANVLGVLASELSGDLLELTIGSVLEIENKPICVEVLAELTRQIPEAEIKRVLEIALQVARDIEDENQRALSLFELGDYLPIVERKWVSHRILQIARDMEYEHDHIELLAKLSLFLPDDEKRPVLEEILRKVRKIRDEISRAIILETIAKYVKDDFAIQARHIATKIGRKYWRARALLNYTAENEKIDVLRQGLKAALREPLEEVVGRSIRVEALEWLSGQLTDELAGQGLKAILDLPARGYMDQTPRRKSLARLAARLKGEMLNQALNSALVIKDESTRANTLANISLNLSGELKYQVLEYALEAVLALEYENVRARALNELGPYLQGAVLERGLHAAIGLPIHPNMSWESPRSHAIVGLVKNLTDELLESKLIAGILELPERNFLDGFPRPDVLSAMANNESKRISNWAFQETLAMTDIYARIHTLVVFIKRLPAETLKEEVNAVLTLPDDSKHSSRDLRANALITLAGYLRDEMLEQRFQSTLELSDENNKAEALMAIIEHLDASFIDQAIEVAMKIKDTYWQANLLTALARRLSGKKKNKVLKQAVASAMTIENEYHREKILAYLGDYVDKKVLEQVIEASNYTKDEYLQVVLLGTLASRTSGRKQGIILEKAVTSAMGIEDEKRRAEAFIKLGKHLNEKLLEQVFTATLMGKDEWELVNVLEALSIQLTGNLVEDRLETIFTIESGYGRANVLEAFCGQLSISRNRQNLSEHFWRARTGDREAVLWTCAKKKLFAPPVFSPAALEHIGRSVIDVGWHWRFG